MLRRHLVAGRTSLCSHRSGARNVDIEDHWLHAFLSQPQRDCPAYA